MPTCSVKVFMFFIFKKNSFGVDGRIQFVHADVLDVLDAKDNFRFGCFI